MTEKKSFTWKVIKIFGSIIKCVSRDFCFLFRSTPLAPFVMWFWWDAAARMSTNVSLNRDGITYSVERRTTEAHPAKQRALEWFPPSCDCSHAAFFASSLLGKQNTLSRHPAPHSFLHLAHEAHKSDALEYKSIKNTDAFMTVRMLN